MIRRATPEDLPHLKDLATEFYHTTKFLKGFDFKRFVSVWKGLLAGSGVIFLSEMSNVGLIGAMGGMCFSDLYTEKIIATEMFWMVHPEHRGCGVRLYQTFESWARKEGCDEIRMVAMADSMPEALDKFYIRKGFERMEANYCKPITDVR